ncbi:uncharacterized protein EDB91DRAFT_1288109 [Suillus paluster]|uniref:uncharacterized protein n=1 Tax=Suillus paluster TaxID=48578 RepID=UPI001B85CCAD|nr:uncharacterized protein EDB91DRAFT_1288109 [Suillus paluster]KAG1738917.1 hypothetical protein EDB91DRAFT_1288109 [Suillus paluster]
MSFCQYCIQGIRHEGEPEGTLETIGGVACYITTPIVDYAKGKAILFLPDAFGIELINSKLLADEFAKNGFKALTHAHVHSQDKTFNFRGWLATHGTEVTLLPLNKIIAALIEECVTRFGAIGYCFGGRYTFDLAFDKVIQCAVVTHSSLLEVPKDLEVTPILLTGFPH